MCHATCQKTLISPSTQERFQCPDTSLNVTLRMKSQYKGALTPQLHRPETATGSKYNLTSGLSPREQLRGQWSSNLITRGGLTLLFQLCRSPAIEVINGEEH